MKTVETTIIKACKPGDYIFRVVDGKLIGDTDPINSAWKIIGPGMWAGFMECQNQATGITSQLNDGLECVVQSRV